VRGTTQFDSKLAAFPDALHQSVDEIVQGSDMLRLIQINIALVPQIDLHGRLIAGSSFNHQELCHRGRY
jgi:acyl-CoA hydrolase